MSVMWYGNVRRRVFVVTGHAALVYPRDGAMFLRDSVVTLPENDELNHPSAFHVKSLKQVLDPTADDCSFVISFHTTKQEDDVSRYLYHIAGLEATIEKCDSKHHGYNFVTQHRAVLEKTWPIKSCPSREVAVPESKRPKMDVAEAKAALQRALDAEKQKNHQMQLQVDDYRGFHGRHITDLRDKDQRLGVLNAELASKDHDLGLAIDRIRELTVKNESMESDLDKANAEIARLTAEKSSLEKSNLVSECASYKRSIAAQERTIQVLTNTVARRDADRDAAHATRMAESETMRTELDKITACTEALREELLSKKKVWDGCEAILVAESKKKHEENEALREELKATKEAARLLQMDNVRIEMHRATMEAKFLIMEESFKQVPK